MDSMADSIFMTFLVLTTGDFRMVHGSLERLVYIFMIVSGLCVIAVLIGFVTDTITRAFEKIVAGRTRVVESNHTLVLGWNDSTVRFITQVAFLRRVFRVQNERWDRRIFWWRRVPPSSPVAKNKVVILADAFSKSQMEELLKVGFATNKIKRKRTKIGQDVIVRVGDPTKTHDLIRVNAHKAT